jgi:two-component system aerobic respiration control sensor histidine kinase ArcB
MAGPTTGAELLTRLSQDLARIDASLAKALLDHDRAQIRAETHVLIAVAGSVGGIGLAEDARALNRVAHEADGTFDPALTQAIARDLAALQALVAARVAR